MKKDRIIIITKFNNWKVAPNVVNLILKLHDKYECVVFYQKPNRVNMKRILRKRGFFLWLDLVLLKYIFKPLLLFKKVFGKKGHMKLRKEKVNSSFNSTENWLKNFAIFHYVKNINNDSNLLINIERMMPLVIISMGAPILGKKFLNKLEYLKILIINSHIGITPDYMGSSPFVWAIYKNDFSKIGFTIHKLSEKVDYGDYLYQNRINISDCKTLTDVDWKLLIKSSSFLAEKIMSGDILKAKPKTHLVDYKSFPPAGALVTLKAFINLRKYINRYNGKNKL